MTRPVMLGATTPALPVRDVLAAVAFFGERLGFTAGHVEEGFAVLRRDAAVLHLWAASDEGWRRRADLRERPVSTGAESFLAGTASCRIETEDVDALFTELAAADVLHPASRGGVLATDFGTREVAALDRDGNLITFVAREGVPLVREDQTTVGRVRVRRWLAENPARLVVLVHGYGEHIGRYGHVAAALVARGASVVGPDHVGHGESGGEPALVADFESVVDDVRAVVERERGGLPVVMVGHSMGGLIATRYAQRHGDELAGLVLSGPVMGLGPVFEGWLAAPEPPSDPIDPAVLSRDPAVGKAYAADPLVHHGGWRRETLEAFLAADRAIAEGPGFGDLPLLHVHGSDDQLVPLALAQPVVERLAGPHTEVHVLEGRRHEVLNELDKDETIALVARFAERVTAS